MNKTPQRLDMKKFRFSPLPFAFLIPFLGALIILAVQGCKPFGNDYAFLYSDEYHQYYPFYTEYRRSLLSGDSLLYNWDIGMGIDYLGLIAYYLSSPLYLLSVFVPESLVLEYFALLSPIKLGLAGLFFAIFLKKIFNKNDISIALFGSLYGLCAWALGYQWNVMWLETFALLPLVALGTISLLRDKKVVLFTVTLFLSIFCNYYIGFFTCIFVLLIFICYQICQFTTFKRLAQDFGRIALYSVLAIGMTAILTLPALGALQTTYSSGSEFPNYFSLHIVSPESLAPPHTAWLAYDEAKAAGADFFDLAGKWFVALFKSIPPFLEGMAMVAGNMSGELAPSTMDGLPNIACGVGTMLLAMLFLTSRDVSKRERLCCVGLLILFIASFLVPMLDYIWHGFHFTNMIPHRFSFLYSFVMLYMAYRAWILRDTFAPWKLAVGFGLCVAFVLFSEKVNNWIFLLYNAAFLLLYLLMFVFSIVDRMISHEEPDQQSRRMARTRQIKTVALCGIMCLELVLILVKYGYSFKRTNIVDYPQGTAASASAFNYIKQREEGSDFYRVETSFKQTLNDSSLNDYSGISTFTSSANVRVTSFLEAMGLASYPSYNRYLYEQTSPVSDLFLNLKYQVERENIPVENDYFDTLYNFDGVYLLENNHYLPLGFLAESSLSEATLEYLTTKPDGRSEINEFTKQNKFFSLATGIDEDVWDMVDGSSAEVTGHNIGMFEGEPKTNNETTWVRYYSLDEAGSMDICYTVHSSGFFALEIYLSEENDFTLYRNGVELFTTSSSVSQIIGVSQVEPGDEIKIHVECPVDSKVTSSKPAVFNLRPAILNHEVFQQGYEVLAASTMDITEFSDTLVKGTIDCNRDGLLYTSIPYYENWSVEVDGKPAEIVAVGDAMISVQLTEGSHTVTFRYENKAFNYGAIISGACLIIFLCLVFIPRYIKKRKGEPLTEIPSENKIPSEDKLPSEEE
ncbi:MAG: YfhO family protein [Oscillospiraceae bacterium]|nr:YfhO family protein [Oscillospiraceae bacterium]